MSVKDGKEGHKRLLEGYIKLHIRKGFSKDEIICISAKTGENVKELLDRIIAKVPSPLGHEQKPLRALIFDTVYDEYRGVIAYVRIIDGQIKKGNKIQFYQNKVITDVTEVGIFTPKPKAVDILSAGELGYFTAGIKNAHDIKIGDIERKFSYAFQHQ